MTREEILATVAGEKDLRPFHDILCKGTPGAQRAWEIIEDKYKKLVNPAALTAYVRHVKEFLLRYCDDGGSRIRTAKACLLLLAESLTDHTGDMAGECYSAGSKYEIYSFEWNDAKEMSPEEAEKALAGLPGEEKADFLYAILSVLDNISRPGVFLEAAGLPGRSLPVLYDGRLFTDSQRDLFDRLCRSFGIEAMQVPEWDAWDEPEPEEE